MAAKRQRRLRLERLEERAMMAGVTVMSENLYMGADPVPALLATCAGGPLVAIPAVTQFWNDVQSTNFKERADAIVQQIATNKPDLIGLQEVMKYWSGTPDSLWGNPTKAQQLELDFLQVVLDKLKAKGVPYQAVAVTTQNEFELPGVIQGQLKDLRMEDRLAILARKDLIDSGAMKVDNVQGGPFATCVTFVAPVLGQLSLKRGWDSVDVTEAGKKFRFINMCLETPVFPVHQALQAFELLVGPANTTLPVILVGDSNNAGQPNAPSFTYNLLVGAGGFKDAWTQTNPGNPGYTWGNDPKLRNSVAMTYQPLPGYGPYRMDLVLYRGPIQAKSMKRVGVLPSERTVTGMWPSDHAGVVATLDLL